MEDLTDEQIDDFIERAHDAHGEIDNAMYTLSLLSSKLRQAGQSAIAGRLSSYTIGNICKFTEEDNHDQIGNLHTDIIVSLEELKCPNDDDLYQIGYDWAWGIDEDKCIDELKSEAQDVAIDLANGIRKDDSRIADKIYEGIIDRVKEIEYEQK